MPLRRLLPAGVALVFIMSTFYAKSQADCEKSCIFAADFKISTDMIGIATPTPTPTVGLDTFTLSVPKDDVSLFKTLAKKMGWKVERKRASKPRLYDPETGESLNEATMKVIEDARNGKDVIEVGSMDEYLKLVSKL